MTEIVFDGTFAGWRRAAREALAQEMSPDGAVWRDGTAAQTDLAFGAAALGGEATLSGKSQRVPRAFLELAAEVACHRDATRWALLYRILWRLIHGEPHLLEVAVDPDVHAARAMAKSVHHDLHKMRAFVRFREMVTEEGPWFVAWFEPSHHIVEANAPFFRDRFASMRWSILTPERSVHWDTRELSFAPGVSRADAPAGDAMEDLWRTYYRSIFNPARLKVASMKAHMPQHYWQNLPEAELISELVAEAHPRTDAMVTASAIDVAQRSEFGRLAVPATSDLGVLRDAASTCQACPLWRKATCMVFGEGPPRAEVVFVGEQPGDQEDRQGKPFVGPAGQLLNRALAAAGVDRSAYYFTNAVKHFKWEPQGKRRLHQRPTSREIAACRPWLEAELKAIRPQRIVCLGATAAQSVLGRSVRVLEERGEWLDTEFGARALITVHPSALLRLPADRNPEEEFAKFVADLQRVSG